MPLLGERIEVDFGDHGWFPGEVVSVEATRIQVKYSDPEDPGPHWHELVGGDAISWRSARPVWFSKIRPFLSHVRRRSVEMVSHSLSAFTLILDQVMARSHILGRNHAIIQRKVKRDVSNEGEANQRGLQIVGAM